MNFELPPLPFGPTALWPIIGQDLLGLHWQVLHAGYLRRWREASLTKRSDRKEVLAFNRNGAVLHDLWWYNLCSAQEGSDPGPVFHGRVGDPEQLERALIAVGHKIRGSGWACLSVKKSGKRWDTKVHAIKNHDYDWKAGWKPLVLIDLWEHAYYPDETDRNAYLERLVRLHIDWCAAEQRLEISAPEMLDRRWLETRWS